MNKTIRLGHVEIALTPEQATDLLWISEHDGCRASEVDGRGVALVALLLVERRAGDRLFLTLDGCDAAHALRAQAAA